MSQRIGGWWRLWIVATIVGAIVATADHSSRWPDKYDILASADLMVYPVAESIAVARHPNDAGVTPSGQARFLGESRVMRGILDSLGAHFLGGGKDPVGRALREARFGVVTDIAVGSFLLSGALLLLGLTAGWIYRRFRPSDNT